MLIFRVETQVAILADLILRQRGSCGNFSLQSAPVANIRE